MAKLCPKGKAAAKRKFKVYPSAYANMYASGVCSGKITPGGKKKNRVKRSDGNPNPKSTTSRREREILMETNRKTDSGMRKKAMGGGMIDMTRMKYLKGGRV
tara:strand:+ start:174 stop:479 length:306 start_codon:yes stop_codon:yes gene_type:complete